MLPAVFVATSAVGYLFLINCGVNRITEWVAEKEKPSVSPRSRDMLKPHSASRGNDWARGFERCA